MCEFKANEISGYDMSRPRDKQFTVRRNDLCGYGNTEWENRWSNDEPLIIFKKYQLVDKRT